MVDGSGDADSAWFDCAESENSKNGKCSKVVEVTVRIGK